jgi:hypothetical protein
MSNFEGARLPEPAASPRATRNLSTASRRASLQAADFQAAVIDHLIHTCAKQPRDAAALDLYHAMSHTVPGFTPFKILSA